MFQFLIPALKGIGGMLGIGGAAKAGAGLLSGGLGSTLLTTGLSALSQRSQMKAAAEAGQLDLGRLRAEALANGFNPLTVLGATGGAGFQSGPGIPGFLSLAAGMIGPALQDNFDRQRQIRNDELAGNLMEAQTRQLEMAAFARANQPAAPRQAPAPTPQSFEEWGMIPAYTSDGRPISVHRGIAERLGIQPHGVWLAEDDEAVLGDLGSVPNQIGVIGDTFWSVIGGWFGADTTPYIQRGHASTVPTAPTTQPAPPSLSIPQRNPRGITGSRYLN